MVTEPLAVAAVQFAPGPDPEENFARALPLVETAARNGARFVALPEAAHYRGPREGLLASAEPVPGPWTDRWSRVARELGVWILAGTLAERDGDGKPFNTSVLLSPRGRVEARYRKIHLFDVDIPGGPADGIRESRATRAGKEIVVADVEGWRVGILICFDLRFSSTWKKLRKAGADLVLLPSNFTRETGKAHWEPLLRARAIEFQTYVVAPACWGRHEGLGIWTNGTASVIGPWGEVLAQAGVEGDAVPLATCDEAQVAQACARIPMGVR